MTRPTDGEAYRTYLEERFQGEVFGEAIMGAVADACAESDPERSAKMRVLEQLEQETKERIRPALLEAGGSDEPDPGRLEEARSLAEGMSKAPWLELMQGTCAELEKLVDEFEAAEALAPPGRESVLEAITEHERALLEFARAELAGAAPDTALAPVRALLRG